MTLGERIQHLRRAGGLSQEQLSEMLGVSRQAVSKWETDQSAPELEKLLLLSRAFSISTDELLGYEVAGGPSAPQLGTVMKRNLRKRQFTIGWVTTVIGLILLILELFSLKIIQFTAMQSDLEHAAGVGFSQDVMAYARVAPMPAIFAITAAIILLGGALTVFSLLRGRA